jgi:hypothetical protein
MDSRMATGALERPGGNEGLNPEVKCPPEVSRRATGARIGIPEGTEGCYVQPRPKSGGIYTCSRIKIWEKQGFLTEVYMDGPCTRWITLAVVTDITGRDPEIFQKTRGTP